MKDFDVIRLEKVNPDRTIKIGGETFEFKPIVAADDWAAWIDGTATTQEEYLGEMDKFILACLEPGQENKWAKVRDPRLKPVPLSKDDISDVVIHIIEVVVGRPTVPPSGSPGGESAGGTSSTEKSQPEAVTSVA